MTAYQYRPDLIYNIDPAPQYPDNPALTAGQVRERQSFKDSLEKFRDNTISKRRQREKFLTGRLFAHLRQEELKQAVQEIHNKEGDAADTDSSKVLIKENGVWVDRFDYDDQFKLPYGVGYDAIIKKRADMVDKQKFWNNRVMDDLVAQLGYMDYRDALAANKYIMEAKKHGDYHQQARAKILSVAMAKYNSQKRQEIENKALASLTSKTGDRDEAKLKVLMDEDPDMARLYREAYGDIKLEKEADEDLANRIHDKYDYLNDDKTLNRRKPTDRYNLHVEKDTFEEELMTTELSDEGLDLLYKRYKVMQNQNSDALKDIETEAYELVQQFNAGTAKHADESGRSMRSPYDLQNQLGLLLNKKVQRRRFDEKLEQHMAQLRFVHSLDNLNPAEVYNEADPNFPGLVPLEDSRNSELLADMPEELKKFFNKSAFPDKQAAFSSIGGIVHDETSARALEDEEELTTKYFRAKWDFYVSEKLRQLKLTTRQLEEKAYYHGEGGKDKMLETRFEFMYNFFDYDNDRSKVRQRLIDQQFAKTTTLKDIGAQLDKFLLDEKAEGLRYLNFTDTDKHLNEQVASASKDTSSFEMSWTGRLFKDTDPLKPLLLDDAAALDSMAEDKDTPYRDILDRIAYEDARTDYSAGSLNADQRSEIALFHSFKQDPFFKHFLYNHLRQFAEDQDEGILNFPEGPFTKSVTDVPKFDRINLYDFRRALPQKDREAKLDGQGAAWGFGKRKTSRAVARVKPGKGTININGKSMLDYFALPSQRYRILLPLVITQYTCLLDVDIWVHGGGLTGQPEAIVPAIAKALQNYDVKTRPVLKYFRLMRHDPRNVERKKYGRVKARKGQVYRRR